MSEPEVTTETHNGVEWTRFEHDYGDHGEVIWQRGCPAGCSKGLVMAPVRFCNRCGGSGLVSSLEDPSCVPGRDDSGASGTGGP